MTLEELEDWIQHLDPTRRRGLHVEGLSGRDHRLVHAQSAPYEWMDHMLRSAFIRMEGAKQTTAIMGVVDRFNAISEGLATAPERCAPIFERTDDGTVLAGACSGS